MLEANESTSQAESSAYKGFAAASGWKTLKDFCEIHQIEHQIVIQTNSLACRRFFQNSFSHSRSMLPWRLHLDTINSPTGRTEHYNISSSLWNISFLASLPLDETCSPFWNSTKLKFKKTSCWEGWIASGKNKVEMSIQFITNNISVIYESLAFFSRKNLFALRVITDFIPRPATEGSLQVHGLRAGLG